MTVWSICYGLISSYSAHFHELALSPILSISSQTVPDFRFANGVEFITETL